MLFRLGLVAAVAAIAGTGDLFLLGWIAVMVICYQVQREAPLWLSAVHARKTFAVAIVLQCLMSIAVAAVTRRAGVSIISLGMLANAIAILYNGLRMPVRHDPEGDATYIKINDCTRVVWFCDIWQTTETDEDEWFASIGDAIECVGIWVLAAELLLARL